MQSPTAEANPGCWAFIHTCTHGPFSATVLGMPSLTRCPRFKIQEETLLLSSSILSLVFHSVHSYLLSMKTHQNVLCSRLQDTRVTKSPSNRAYISCARWDICYKEKELK